MRRMMLILTTGAVMAVLLMVASAPAMAQDFDLDGFDDGFFCDDDDDDFDGFIECDDLFFGDLGGGGTFLESENEAESGDVDLSFDVSNTGDFAQQSTPALQFGNSGNFNNAPSFVQFGGNADDFESGGIEFTVAPSLGSESSQTIRQSSSASR